MKIVLELLDQSSSVRKITVRHDIVIGRGSDCNLRLSAPQVSRRHCFLRVSRDGVSITDLESSNGTWVNGNRLPSSVRQDLTDGSQISLGPVRFLVHVRPEAVPGSVLPGGSLNEVITEAAGSPDATTFSGRDAALQHRNPEPRTSSVHALRSLSPDSSHAADSRLEIVALGLQLSGDSSPQDAVVIPPPAAPSPPLFDRIENATTAHDIDIRGMAALDGVDVLDPAVLAGQFPPDRPMWSREAALEPGLSDEPTLPPTLPLNAQNGIHDFPELEDALECDALEPELSSDSDPDAIQAASAEDDDPGPELAAFLKGL
ncbi:MAG: FHA domain-containing protein [Planctomycetaceae bacterium]